ALPARSTASLLLELTCITQLGAVMVISPFPAIFIDCAAVRLRASRPDLARVPHLIGYLPQFFRAFCDSCADSAAPLGLKPGLRQFLESAGVIDRPITELFQGLAAQRRPPAGSAIDQDRLVRLQRRVVRSTLGVGAEFQHAARDMDRTLDL